MNDRVSRFRQPLIFWGNLCVPPLVTEVTISPKRTDSWFVSHENRGVYSFSNEFLKLLNSLASRFQISPDCRYMLTTVTFEIGDERFSCSGKRLLVEGFTGVTPWQAITQDETMPTFNIDDLFPLQDVSFFSDIVF
jgi:hypothetical protein